MKLKPGLYIVSTPIGNMGDITYRALDILRLSDFIFAEDTRITKKLLDKHNITTPLKTYNDHSDEGIRHNIMDIISKGGVVSLVSDAGTPLLSDPGYKLVRLLKQNNYNIDVAPGPSAILASLSISGLPTDKFMFCGFIPKTKHAKNELFAELLNIRCTLIFFETCSRLEDSLVSALEVLGDREASIAREITKLYQDVRTSTITELISTLKTKPVKGEIVLLISGHSVKCDQNDDIDQKITSLLKQGYSKKSVTDLIFSTNTLYKKNELYKKVNESAKIIPLD
jgi:16S rRNA (cytidine1402-2'-O)-methyltransferase